MPLILDMANITNELGKIDFIDGKSFKRTLLNDTKDDDNWREDFLVEYVIGAGTVSLTYNAYFNTCAIW